MRGESINWLYMLENDLHPDALSSASGQHTDFSDYGHILKKDIQQFKPRFLHLVGRSAPRAKALLVQLTLVSNSVYSYMVNMGRSYRGTPISGQISGLYRKTLDRLETLLDFCYRFDTPTFMELPVTAYSAATARMQLRQQLRQLGDTVCQSDVDPSLRDTLLNGLKSLIERAEMSRSNILYATELMEALGKSEQLTTTGIENILYQYDFNTPGFFNYCATACDTLIADTPSLSGQLEALIGIEERINGLPPRTALRWMPDAPSIREQLKEFIRERKQYTGQRIEIRRNEIRDGNADSGTDRMQINMPVAQLGLFIRVSMEKGLLPSEAVGKTFAYYARHFSTPRTPFISAESLQKKSTDVEFTTAKKLKTQLIGMVNWLNEHYNVSNYRGS